MHFDASDALILAGYLMVGWVLYQWLGDIGVFIAGIGLMAAGTLMASRAGR